VLVPRTRQEALVDAFTKAYNDFYPYPEGALDPASSLGKIISPAHHSRLVQLLSRTKGTIAVGGRHNDKSIEPSVIKDVTLNDALMEE
jgi:aldehyde dehydrogenase (NAD+)